MKRCLDAIAVRPRTVMLVFALVLALALLGLSRLRILTDLSVLGTGPDSAAATLAQIESLFPAADALLVVASVPPTTESTNPALAVAELRRFESRLADLLENDARFASLGADVVQAADEKDEAERFTRDVIFPHLPAYLDTADRAELAERLTPAGIAAQLHRVELSLLAPGPAGGGFAQQRAGDPLGLFEWVLGVLPAAPGRLTSTDGHARLIRVHGTDHANNVTYARQLVDGVREAVAIAADGTAITCDYTGAYAIAAYADSKIRTELMLSVPTSAVLITTAFLLMYRRVLAGLLVGAAVAGALLVGFGLWAGVRGGISHIGMLSAAVLIGLAIDYAIHAMSKWTHGRPLHGHRRARVLRMMRQLRRPMALAAATTMIGFGAVALSPMRATRDFGMIGLLGVAAAALIGLFVMPHLLRAVRFEPARPWGTPGLLLAGVARHRRAAVAIGGALWVGLVAGAVVGDRGQPWFDPDVANLHPQPNPPLAMQHALAERFDNPAEDLLIFIDAPDGETLLQRAYAAHDSLDTDALRALGVRVAFGLPDLLPRASGEQGLPGVDPQALQRELEEQIAASALNPNPLQGYAQAASDMARPKPPLGLSALDHWPHMRDRVAAHDPDSGRWATLMVAATEQPLLDATQRAHVVDAVNAALGDVPGARLSGFAALGVDLERAAMSSLPIAALSALCAVTLVLWLTYRSVTSIALAMVPPLITLTALTAYMRIAGLGWNLVTLIALPLIVGLGVDHGVFVFEAARRTLRRKGGAEALVRHALPVAQAVTAVTITTMLGFGTLIFSSTPAIAQLGELMLVGSGLCLLASMGIQLPALAILLERRRVKAEGAQ